jgi:hypothetical protein
MIGSMITAATVSGSSNSIVRSSSAAQRWPYALRSSSAMPSR